MAEYPKILICSLSRINMHDTQSNNLLLRNLFYDWPREQLAQIYSGGENTDEGFCRHTYRIAEADRRWGSLFFRLKGTFSGSETTNFSSADQSAFSGQTTMPARWRHSVGQYVMESGLYELIFKIRPSRTLMAWVAEISPDIIFAQGYSLSFVILPLLMKRQLHKPIAFYCSDDWPSYLYQSKRGMLSVVSMMMRKYLADATTTLLEESDIPFSFNSFMGAAYERQYGKPFTPMMHGDIPERFQRAPAIRLQPPDICSIVVAGGFDDSRWPLLMDLEEACRRLNHQGVCVKATVLATSFSPEGYSKIRACRYIEVRDDPGHEALPSYLKGADILFLPETFDKEIVRFNRFSISTKAHLFMFSRQPILVYGDPKTGLVSYARREGWASIVDQRNPDVLVAALREMVHGTSMRRSLISKADVVAMTNHDSTKIRKTFLTRLTEISAYGNRSH